MVKHKLTEEQILTIRNCIRHTHTIWTESYATQVGEVFGFQVRTYEFEDSRDQFKGVKLKGEKVGKVQGIDSESILEQISVHLKFKPTIYKNYEGRGRRVVALGSEILDAF